MRTFTRLTHANAAKKSDEDLVKEAVKRLSDEPAIQLLTEVLGVLRDLELPWWTPEQFCTRFSAATVMGWLSERPDLRQEITTKLTGLGQKMTRKKSPADQAALIDDAIESGDADAKAYMLAIPSDALAVYGDAPAVWSAFRDNMDWTASDQPHKELIAQFIERLLSQESSLSPDIKRTPILSHLDVRGAINEEIWEKHMPSKTRVDINRARLAKEREQPDVPFRAKDELAIANASIITEHVPLDELNPIFLAAERAMGFEKPGAALSEPPPSFNLDKEGDSSPPVRASDPKA
jgi:hypothetical protein